MKNRPQEPKPPYPYKEEEVSYKNRKENITLSATLTIPDTEDINHPVVILIHGMGPMDRDYTMLGHKLFLLLSDHLTRQGIAVLRYDKRGVGASTGKFDLTVTSDQLANDVFAAVEYLKDKKDYKKIGLIGHSEGGMIAPMVNLKSNDVSFIVLMAAVVTTSIDNIVEQSSMQLKADGATEKIIEADKALRKLLLTIVKIEKNNIIAKKEIKKAIADYWEKLPELQKAESNSFLFAIKESNADQITEMFVSPWYRYLLNHDPASLLSQIRIPLLAINGNLDFITSSKISLPIITEALEAAKNKNYTVQVLPNLNHWFQTCKTGSMMEYGQIEETMSPLALNTMSEWILKTTNPEIE